MKELLAEVTVFIKVVFTEWIPLIANAAFGTLGELTTAVETLLIIFAIVGAIFGMFFFKKRR